VPAVGQVEAQEESSFCEQKEAKKLCQLGSGSRLYRPARSDLLNKSFLLLFFKKDAASFA